MKCFRMAVLPGLLAASVFATPVQNCAVAPLSAYVAASGTPCQVGDLLFSTFAYGANHFPGHPGPPATSIFVTPINNPLNPGFLFSSSGWSVAAGSYGDSTISYTVTTVSGAADIGIVDVNMQNNVVTDPVTFVAQETVCLVNVPAGMCPDPNAVNLRVSHSPNPLQQEPNASFTPVSQITVIKDIFFASDSATGTGTIVAVTNTFPTPEPVTSLLSLSGLLILWRVVKKRSRGDIG